MKRDDALAIIQADYDGDLELYEGYSGRGMYGERTTGVTGDRTDIIRAAQTAGVDIASLSWDNMGKSDVIAY